jgi:hypothetical protein
MVVIGRLLEFDPGNGAQSVLRMIVDFGFESDNVLCLLYSLGPTVFIGRNPFL